MGAAAAGEAGICRACPSALRNHTPADGLKKQGEQEEPQGGGSVEGATSCGGRPAELRRRCSMEGGGRALPQGGQLVFPVSVVAPRQRPAARWEGGGPEGQTGALEDFHHAFGEN